MISKIARLRAKKGFTIVELIVVMAIIGVLTSVVVASLSYDRKPALGKSMAKDMYYKAQDCLASARVGFSHAFDTGADPLDGFFVEVDGTGEITNWGTIVKNATAGNLPVFTPTPALSELSHEGTVAADHNAVLVRLKEAFENYLSQTDNMEGTLYVVFDQFKVLAAYWSDSTFSAAVGTTGLLVEDYILDDGYYFCSYPIYKSFEGERAFSDIIS